MGADHAEAGEFYLNPMSKTFLDRTSYYGQIVEMDRLGCMLVPRMLREAAQIKGEVAVVGKLTHLEVRNVKAS